jgi:protein arginine kinase
MNKPVNNINCAWINEAKATDYIVVSSRVRLARNLQEFVFPTNISLQDSQKVVNKLKEIITKNEQFNYYKLSDLNNLSKLVLVEKHLISPQFANVTNRDGAVLINNEGSISIMVNEEDHLRLQCILPGLNLNECYNKVNEIDESFEKELNYAYDSQLGYLTSCPTNIGTGMRASVMLHLPALVKTKNIAKAFDTAAKFGFVARGIYGEGTEGLGNMFQISNQITLGRSEEDIINSLSNLVKQLVDYEINARKYLVEHYQLELEDSIGRAWGIMTGARKMSSEEAMKLLSNLRLGAERNLVVKITAQELNKIMLEIQPASLQHTVNERLNADNRDIMRATILRQRLQN